MVLPTQTEIYTWVHIPASRPSFPNTPVPKVGQRLTLGHALNKILKDIILRYSLLQRRKVSYIPGWDCHGLPIELKAVKSKQGKYLSAPTIRAIARNFAEKTVQRQLEEFKSWGVMGDWENRWLTMGTFLTTFALESWVSECRSGV
jgi:isoleucyl-tRNA synthetase